MRHRKGKTIRATVQVKAPEQSARTNVLAVYTKGPGRLAGRGVSADHEGSTGAASKKKRYK